LCVKLLTGSYPQVPSGWQRRRSGVAGRRDGPGRDPARGRPARRFVESASSVGQTDGGARSAKVITDLARLWAGTAWPTSLCCASNGRHRSPSRAVPAVDPAGEPVAAHGEKAAIEAIDVGELTGTQYTDVWQPGRFAMSAGIVLASGAVNAGSFGQQGHLLMPYTILTKENAQAIPASARWQASGPRRRSPSRRRRQGRDRGTRAAVCHRVVLRRARAAGCMKGVVSRSGTGRASGSGKRQPCSTYCGVGPHW